VVEDGAYLTNKEGGETRSLRGEIGVEEEGWRGNVVSMLSSTSRKEVDLSINCSICARSSMDTLYFSP